MFFVCLTFQQIDKKLLDPTQPDVAVHVAKRHPEHVNNDAYDHVPSTTGSTEPGSYSMLQLSSPGEEIQYDIGITTDDYVGVTSGRQSERNVSVEPESTAELPPYSMQSDDRFAKFQADY